MTARSLEARLAHPLPHLDDPAVTLSELRGLRAAGVAAGIKASGRPDVALLVSDAPMACAGVFTQNLFAAAPVEVSRAHLAASGGWVRAVVVNSGNANACTGAQGLADAREMCDRVAAALGLDPTEVLVCSTGVIGHPLPMERVRAGIDAARRGAVVRARRGATFSRGHPDHRRLPQGGWRPRGRARRGGRVQGRGHDSPRHGHHAGLRRHRRVAHPRGPVRAHRAHRAAELQRRPRRHAPEHQRHLPALRDGRRRRGRARARLCPAASVSRRLAWLIARDGEGATKVTTVR
jgi:hypothetical protein